MIPILIEAALRSLLLALAVWAGLRVFRVRNVLAQKSAWGLVLASALLMPILAPFAARWQFLPSGATLTLPPHPMALLKSWRPAPQPVASLRRSPRSRPQQSHSPKERPRRFHPRSINPSQSPIPLL